MHGLRCSANKALLLLRRGVESWRCAALASGAASVLRWEWHLVSVAITIACHSAVGVQLAVLWDLGVVGVS